MGILFGLLIPVVVLGGLGGLVFLLVRGGHRAGDPLSSRTVLRGYLRFASSSTRTAPKGTTRV